MKRHSVLLTILLTTAMISCKKEKQNVIPPPTYGDVVITMGYHVDGKPLYLDSIMYTNEAGNRYSVTRLQYYISRVCFYKAGAVQYSSDTIVYADAKYSQTFLLANVPAGIYDSISCYIGMDEAQNSSYSLPATFENTNMIWPATMGGGYHFLKLEGYWDDSGAISGYAMHLGRNGFVVKAGVKSGITVIGGTEYNMTLNMNINEWFRRPQVYNLATDGVYSMGNAVLMKKLSNNGADVFSR